MVVSDYVGSRNPELVLDFQGENSDFGGGFNSFFRLACLNRAHKYIFPLTLGSVLNLAKKTKKNKKHLHSMILPPPCIIIEIIFSG